MPRTPLEKPTPSPKSQRHNKIICGDCLKELKKLPENSIDLVVTDPPYFLDGLDNGWDSKKIERKTQKAGVIGGLPVGMKFDPKQGIAFQDFYGQVSDLLLKVLKPGAYFLSFSKPRLFHRMAMAVEEANFEIRDQYIWHYRRRSQMKAFSMGHFVDKRKDLSPQEKATLKGKLNGRKTPQLRSQFESILLAQKPKEGTFIDNWLAYGTGLINTSVQLNSEPPSTVMNVEKPDPVPFESELLDAVMQVEKPKKESYNCHLTVKPVRLMEHLVKIFSTEGQVVLDPFLGSGTTAIACQNTKRHYIGIELNKEYVKIANKRLRGDIE